VSWPALANEPPFVGHDPDARAAFARPPTRTLPERESLDRLAGLGLPVEASIAADSADSAVAAARRIGGPVVLKVDVEGLAHKSDVGGVRVGLGDEASIRAAADDLLALRLPPGTRSRGLLVSRRLDGVELILGGRCDPSYGPIVLVGLGGILAEAIDDVAVRLAPLDAVEAGRMLDELRGRRILGGARGRLGIDRGAVVAAIVALGQALLDDPTLIEVDLNPLISGPHGTAAVDALVVEIAP
jgi:succinyl-CoA synthetase beta subunit